MHKSKGFDLLQYSEINLFCYLCYWHNVSLGATLYNELLVYYSFK